MRLVAIVFSVVISILISSCKTKKEITQKSTQKPNIVLIIADDLGYGDLSCYGTSAVKTPAVDKLASEGIRFTNAHATAATCTPSRYSIFTGEYNWRKNDTGIADGDAPMVIKPSQKTIASVCKSAGYKTAAIGKWHLGLSDEKGNQDWNGAISPNPSDIGFEYSFIMAATADRVPCVWIENGRVSNYDVHYPIFVSYTQPFENQPLGKTNPELLTKLKPSKNHGHNQAIVNGISRIGYMKGGGKALWHDEHIADTITHKAVEFIEKNKENPFFLYVGTNDVHVPRYPNATFVGKSGLGLRGDAILQFDWTISEIVKSLKINNLLDNTLIIVTSDNGPVIDDGYQDLAEELLQNHNPWGEFHYRGGKYSNFQAGVCIPFVVYFPQKIKKGMVSNALFSQVDLFATISAFIGQEIPEKSAKDSQNRLETLFGTDKKGRDYVITSGGALAVNTADWKYIEPSQRPDYQPLTKTFLGNSKLPQLYNLKKDKAETENVAEKYPEKLNELRKILEKEKQK